jgi:hypothetical protein
MFLCFVVVDITEQKQKGKAVGFFEFFKVLSSTLLHLLPLRFQ